MFHRGQRDRNRDGTDLARRDLSHIFQCRYQRLRGVEIKNVVFPEEEARFSVDLTACSRKGKRNIAHFERP